MIKDLDFLLSILSARALSINVLLGAHLELTVTILHCFLQHIIFIEIAIIDTMFLEHMKMSMSNLVW